MHPSDVSANGRPPKMVVLRLLKTSQMIGQEENTATPSLLVLAPWQPYLK